MSTKALLSGDLVVATGVEILSLVQVTDTHLTGTEEGRLLGVNTERSARRVIDAALASENADCFLVTGDIAADGQPEAYGQLQALVGTSVPSLWLPGNHDDVSSHLDRYASHMKRRLRAKYWDVVMLETQVEGEVGGVLSITELAALKSAVDDARLANKALLVATHHPLRRLESAWLDEQAVENADEALEILKPIAGQTALISGHVHQESDEVVNGVRMMTTPSTCVQFAPRAQDFALDITDPGYRRLVLHPNARIETQVIRISDEENRPLLISSGYH
ncbi:MAG: metallophosphoesterase [Pseudomonadota bacterium]|nr:metallophosphoesterase [Pseudomonadota bacterium]